MKRVIRIPRGGIPRRQMPEDPDTPGYARARIVLYALVLLLYCSLTISSLFGGTPLGWTRGVLVGGFMLLMIPMIDYNVRPGRGRVWILTLATMPVLYYVPILLIALPLVLLAAQMWRQLRRHGAPPRPPNDVRSSEVPSETTSDDRTP